MIDNVDDIGRHAQPLADGLRVLIEVQRIVSAPVSGAIPTGTAYPTKDALRTYTFAMIVEIAEWVQTLDWKPWKNAATVSSPAQHSSVVAEEWSDVMAFMGILMLYLEQYGITPEHLADAYVRKSDVNVQRIKEQLGGA